MGYQDGLESRMYLNTKANPLDFFLRDKNLFSGKFISLINCIDPFHPDYLGLSEKEQSARFSFSIFLPSLSLWAILAAMEGRKIYLIVINTGIS